MTYKKRSLIVASLTLTLSVLTACVAPPQSSAPSQPQPTLAPGITEPLPTDTAAVAAAATAAPGAAGSESVVTTWYYYDQNNTDEKANERAGNFYIAKTLPLFNEAHAGQFKWENVPRDYNLNLDLVTAVQTGGDVPDVMQFDITQLPTYLLNNTLQDVEWVKEQSWFGDLDPQAVEACTVDGKLYCIPISESPWLTYYYTDFYKDGFPKTPEALLQVGGELSKDGNYALTYWGNTLFDGEAAGRYFYQVISSFGGSYDDGQGNMKLNTPENIKGIEFMREVVKNGLSSESVFAGNFEEEEAFKQGKAGAFPTSFFIAVRYLNPLKSPAGKDYKNIEDAVNDKAVALAPFVAPEGNKPGCSLDLFGFVVPRTAENLEGSKAYINWIMDPKNTVDWIVNAGGGFPTGTALRADPTFQTELYKQAQTVGEASTCRPWFGSLRRIPEAKKIVTNTIYDLIKAKPDADIGAELTKAEAEYNQGN